MEDIIEVLSRLSPFTSFFEYLGAGKETSAILSTLLSLLICYGFVLLTRRLYKGYKEVKKAREEIRPQVDYKMEQLARQYYIPTQYQNASPTRQEEPGFTHKYVARNKLIPFFINMAFDERQQADRFYLVLGDSGMGKTTFMINLYFSYHSFWSRRKYKLKLFRFANTDTLDLVKAISIDEARNTILLLDALDEDHNILSTDEKVSDADAFRNRVDEIITAVRNFREVIITCRTQYFPGQEDDPYELKILRPDEKGYYTLNKIYISPFTEGEVKKYLGKKFGVLPFINRKKKKLATEIISRSKNLIVRPMLLSYIDYLLEDGKVYDSTYELYRVLIEKWLIRESEKRKLIGERQGFIDKLREVSKKIAVRTYQNWKINGKLYLSREESVEIAQQSGIELKPAEVTGQSLLTTDGMGNWRFAHRSILEFFLAQMALDNITFFRDFNFSGMDMAERFYNEENKEYIFIPNDFIERPEFFKNKNDEPDEHSGIFMKLEPQITEMNSVVSSRKDRFGFTTVLTADYMATLARYLNELNISNGYPPVYNDYLMLLDSTGKRAKYIDLIHGFRLPTIEEWAALFLKGRSQFDTPINRSNISKPKFFNDTAIKELRRIVEKRKLSQNTAKSMNVELIHFVNNETGFVDLDTKTSVRQLDKVGKDGYLSFRVVYIR